MPLPKHYIDHQGNADVPICPFLSRGQAVTSADKTTRDLKESTRRPLSSLSALRHLGERTLCLIS